MKLKKAVIALLAFTSNAFAPILYAEENTARQQSCEFVSTLIEEGSVAGADTFAEMFSWGDVETRSIRSSIRVLEDFEFDLGNIYLMTDFDGLAERHLAVLSKKIQAPCFYWSILKESGANSSQRTLSSMTNTET